MRRTIPITISFLTISLSAGCFAGDEREEGFFLGKTAIKGQTLKLVTKAQSCSKSGDFTGSAAALAQAVKLNPHSPELHVNLAASLYQINDYPGTIRECNEALKIDSKMGPAWSTAAAAYEMTGELEKAKDAYKKAIQLEPQNPRNQSFSDALQGLEKELLRRSSQKPDPTNYVADVTSFGVRSWSAKKMPLKIYIASGSGVKSYRPEFTSLMKQSFLEWAKSSAGAISINFVEDPHSNDIACSWTNDRSKFAAADEAGHSIQTVTTDGVLHADITMACTNANGLRITTDGMHRYCLHEVGHALGLHGHSRVPADIMFSASVPAPKPPIILTRRDIATIRALYRLKFTPPEEEKTISSSTHVEKGIDIGNDGGNDLADGKIESAISKLEKALNMSPENVAARINLGMAYNDLAERLANKKDAAGAERAFKKSIEVLELEPSGQYINDSLNAYSGFLKKQGRNQEAAAIKKKCR